MDTIIGVGLFLLFVTAGCLLMRLILFVTGLPKDRSERNDYLLSLYVHYVLRRIERWQMRNESTRYSKRRYDE